MIMPSARRTKEKRRNKIVGKCSLMTFYGFVLYTEDNEKNPRQRFNVRYARLRDDMRLRS
jgi:hypothetical protein